MNKQRQDFDFLKQNIKNMYVEVIIQPPTLHLSKLIYYVYVYQFIHSKFVLKVEE